MEQVLQERIFFPIKVISWILSLPFRGLSWTIEKVRARLYDPEHVICPGCGFRGDSGTNGKTCWIKHVETTGPERAANEHSCFRCSAKYYSKLFVPAEKWMAPKQLQDKIRQVAARAVL